jgi:hypothetical protein
MAHIQATHIPAQNPVAALFTRVLEALVSISETNHRVAEVERLQALSDAELAKRGLRREDIARHVFRDLFYI